MDGLLSALELDPRQGFTILGASQLANAYYPPLNPDLGALILDLDSESVVVQAKSVLLGLYSSEQEIVLLKSQDDPVEHLTLAALDPSIFAPALYIPPVEALSSFESLQATVAHLRAPEGCPWDREQTHQSLRKHLLEEAYETLEAIDRGDLDGLREELGDLLLQILMNGQIAYEDDRFRITDVIAGIQGKLIRRHPHVFGDVEVSDVDQVLTNWEHFKREEKETGPLDGVPHSFPALAQAAELQDRAGRVGFKWPSTELALAKINEELEELVSETDAEYQAVELGDLLFAVVNYARWLKADPEAELQRANQRFRIRFAGLLEAALQQDLDLEQLEIGELMRLWDETKSFTV